MDIDRMTKKQKGAEAPLGITRQDQPRGQISSSEKK